MNRVRQLTLVWTKKKKWLHSPLACPRLCIAFVVQWGDGHQRKEIRTIHNMSACTIAMKPGFPYELLPSRGPLLLADGSEICINHVKRRYRQESNQAPWSAGRGLWPLCRVDEENCGRV